MKNIIPLWQDKVPYFNPEYGDFKPYLCEYILENSKVNSAVLVIPGGGYEIVSVQNEGDDICRYLNENGMSAFYLNYRVAPYSHPCMEEDAKRALRLIRFNAEKWNINPDKIAVIGFSAGGHLTCMSALRFDYGREDGDEIDAVSSRPDAAAPCYGVNSLDLNITHHGTYHHLLGENASKELADMLSPENIIPEDAPPFFLWHTAEDTCVNPECSLRLASELIKAGIACELHIFPFGQHGSGLAKDIPLANQWPALFVNWLREFGF